MTSNPTGGRPAPSVKYCAELARTLEARLEFTADELVCAHATLTPAKAGALQALEERLGGHVRELRALVAELERCERAW